jgi:hypothetical protein
MAYIQANRIYKIQQEKDGTQQVWNRQKYSNGEVKEQVRYKQEEEQSGKPEVGAKHLNSATTRVTQQPRRPQTTVARQTT